MAAESPPLKFLPVGQASIAFAGFSKERVKRLVKAARAPMHCSGRTFNVSASIGLALAQGEAPIALFTKADIALYAVKAAGGDAFHAH